MAISTHMPYVVSDDELDVSSSITSLEGRYEAFLSRHSQIDASDEEQVYQAFAMMTDDFVGRLIERMEEDGRLDDTVILFLSDHYSYSLDGTPTDSSLIDIQNIPCFIYSKDIEGQAVEKVCSNLDLLPTITNLFGIETDTKFMGNDIFDDEEGIAYLPSGDWITDRCMYFDGNVVESYDDEVTEEYIDEINKKVLTQIRIGNLIDYSRYYKGM